MPKTTLILGATPNPSRYANIAAHRLTGHGHPIRNVGIKDGEVAGEPIVKGTPDYDDIDTVTLYLGPQRQEAYYDYIVDELQPRRIIFNPGTENEELRARAEAAGIETDYACTLVMLNAATY